MHVATRIAPNRRWCPVQERIIISTKNVVFKKSGRGYPDAQPTLVTKKKRAMVVQGPYNEKVKTKPKKLLVPFHQQIRRNFAAATPD